MYDFLCENVDTPVLVVVLFKCLICLLALVCLVSHYVPWLHGGNGICAYYHALIACAFA